MYVVFQDPPCQVHPLAERAAAAGVPPEHGDRRNRITPNLFPKTLFLYIFSEADQQGKGCHRHKARNDPTPELETKHSKGVSSRY